MVSDEALKKLQEQIAAWPMTQRFVVQQLIEDYRMDREDLRVYEDTKLTPEEIDMDHEAAEQLRRLCRDFDLDRLEELVKADKDGWLVVLPYALPKLRREDGRCKMKVCKNPWVTRESYFVKTGVAKSAKMEARKSSGYSIDFWEGEWIVRKSTIYDKSLTEMPIVFENRVALQSYIDKAILDTVLGFVKGQKMDGGDSDAKSV